MMGVSEIIRGQKNNGRENTIKANIRLMDHSEQQSPTTQGKLGRRTDVNSVLNEVYPHLKKKKKRIRVKFRDTQRWRKLSKKVRRENPFCVSCGYLGDDVDHINPVASGGALYAEDNLQVLCKSCHSKKTAKETNFGIEEL